MELIQQPELKSKYDKCKYRVKLWEYEFKKKNGRPPSKLDIREASKEVRLAYKTYFHLKSAALEKSFVDVEGFESDEETCNPINAPCNFNISTDTTQGLSKEVENETDLNDVNSKRTWGEHLSNRKEVIEEKREIISMNTSFSQKLFGGSKFSKRNPRKSLSFNHRKSESSFIVSKSLSQPNNPCPIPEKQPQSFLTQEDSSGQISFLLSQNVTLENLTNDNVKVVTVSNHVSTQPVSVIQSVLNNEYRLRRNLDSGWIDRVTMTTGAENKNDSVHVEDFLFSQGCLKSTTEERTTKLDYESDDVIDNSDDEVSKSVLHVAKKLKLNRQSVGKNNEYNSQIYTTLRQTESAIADTVIEQTPRDKVDSGSKKLDFANIFEKAHTSKNTEYTVPVDGNEELNNSEVKQKSGTSLEITKGKSKVKFRNKNRNKHNLEEANENERKSNTKHIRKKNVMKNEQMHVSDTLNRRSSRPKKIVNLKETSDSEKDVYFSDDDDSIDPEFNVNIEKSCGSETDEGNEGHPKSNNKETVKEKPRNNRNQKNKQQKSKTAKEANEENIESSSYVLEYSVNPRITTAPRIPRFKKVTESPKLKDFNKQEQTENISLVKDKTRQQKEKLEKKMASGNLNENFVRINLKKKIYVRGKKNMNYGKYKKQMWKNKKKTLAGPDMDMGGCDGGLLTCFNCGQVGHFARQCKNAKGDNLLPLSAADEDDCPYPTLEEVAKLAQESILAIRKPNMKEDSSCRPEKILDSTAEDSSIETNASPVVKKAGEGASSAYPDKSSKVNADDQNSVQDEASVSENNELSAQEGITADTFEESDDDDLLAETLKLEEYVAKLDVKQYMDSTTLVKPYYDSDKVCGSSPEVLQILRKFGHDSFRPGQESAVMRILAGKSTLVTLSTGSGKSLCYQLPAYMYSQREPCLSLVISPLVSLMEDQVTGIPVFLKAACLHTNQTKTQREKIMDAIAAGNLNVLLVSPEAVVAGERSTGFGSLLRKLPPIAFACIDEAHCVSQWSHNFRPSYLMICRILRESLGIKTILGLTATATRSTCDSIVHHLQIPDGGNGIISDVPLPDNLRLTVSKDLNRDQALLGLLLSERFASCKSVIVYCIRRDECERVATFLRTSLKEERQTDAGNKKRKRFNVQAEPYHAGMSASRRRTIQKAFMSGELRIVVATVAFGMGINKSDIRAVIHYNMPRNFECYVQEVGRAGRDGLPAHCHVFLDSQGRDENELRRHIYANSMDRHVIRKLLQKIFIPCACKEKCPKHEVAFSIEETVLALDIPEENISTLLCYLELHDNRYIEVLSPAYITCRVISYSGPMQIRKAAKDCPPLAMALALYKSRVKEDNVFEFPVVDVASAMGWDSGICKHKLKNLEWTSENNQPKRSSLSVQFSNLGFRLLAPGNLSDSELDNALDSLYQRVADQEKKGLLQLHALTSAVTSIAQKTYKTCISDEISEEEKVLKTKIREYFESPDPLDELEKLENKPVNEDVIISDTNALVCMYRDNVFTGRTVARIFHGIQSPNYPAVIWGRCRFWRSHMYEDFNVICKIATGEILRMR